MPVHILDKFWINHRSAIWTVRPLGRHCTQIQFPSFQWRRFGTATAWTLKMTLAACVGCWMMKSRSVTLSHIHEVAFLQILTSLVTSPYVLWLFLAPSHPFDGNSLPTSIEWLSGVRLLAEQDFHRSHRTMFQPTAPSPPKKRKSVWWWVDIFEVLVSFSLLICSIWMKDDESGYVASKLDHQNKSGGFRKWGYPYIIHFNRVFHYLNQPAIGVSPFVEISILINVTTSAPVPFLHFSCPVKQWGGLALLGDCHEKGCAGNKLSVLAEKHEKTNTNSQSRKPWKNIENLWDFMKAKFFGLQTRLFSTAVPHLGSESLSPAKPQTCSARDRCSFAEGRRSWIDGPCQTTGSMNALKKEHLYCTPEWNS